MSAGLADAALLRIRGTQAAQHAIFKLRQGCQPGELLLASLLEVLAADDDERTVGRCHEIQKCLERSL